MRAVRLLYGIRGLQPARRIGRQIVGGTSARCWSCCASRRADRGCRAGLRGVHVWTVTVPVTAAAAVDGAGARPSPVDQTASADRTTVLQEQQGSQPDCRHDPYIQPEPAARPTRRSADGAGGRKPQRLLQASTPGGEVPAHQSVGGAAGGHRGPGAIGETDRSSPGRALLAACPFAGRRRAAVHVLQGCRGRRVWRLLACLVGNAHASGRRLRILHKRCAAHPRIGADQEWALYHARNRPVCGAVLIGAIPRRVTGGSIAGQ